MTLHSAFGVKGYDQLDLIEMQSESRGFDWEAGSGFKINRGDDFGIGVRAIVKGKVGHAFANRYEDLKDSVKRAIKLAKYSNVSFRLEKFGLYKKPQGIFDKELMKTEDSVFLEQLKELIASTRSEKCTPLAVHNSAGQGWVHYVNSEGVDVEEKSTDFGVSWELECKSNTCYYGIEKPCFVRDIKKELARTCELARLQTKKVSVKTGSVPIIFHHFVLPSFLTYAILPAFSAMTIQQGKSKLEGRVGEKVFSSKLSIVDDGMLTSGIGSSSFDSEGVPCRKTKLVEKGVLKGFLYDLARASKDKVASTGNGFRSYASSTSISPSNFIVAKGKKDVVSEVDKGIMLYGALNVHSVDYVSGDFSIGACPAFVIEKGELVGSPNKLMLSGNIYNVLNKIKSIGNDQVSLSGGVFGGSTIVTPSILSECFVVGE